MYQLRHFRVEEFVPKSVYSDRGEKAIQLMDSRVLMLADAIRERYGPTTINNWVFGGDREWSGLRTPESPYFSLYSQHSAGRAIDCICRDKLSSEIRLDFKAGVWNSWLRTNNMQVTLEEGVSWLHIDVRWNEKLVSFFKV